MEGHPFVERGTDGQSQGRCRPVGIAAHEGHAAPERLDVVAAAARSTVVYKGTFILTGTIDQNAIP